MALELKYLIVCTLPEDNAGQKDIVNELSGKLDIGEVLYTDSMEIKGCCGCNSCWLRTPGICAIKDDYEKILIKFLQAGRTLFIAETKLGFVSYKMKNLMDRILPLATMYLRFKNGQMRHYQRYKKELEMGLIYTGEGDREYLGFWMDRAILNLNGKSLGAHRIDDREGLYHALDNY